jgi:Tfp pilus assembly protein PilF
MTTSNRRVLAMTALVAATAVWLSGCQAFRSILPDQSKQKNAAVQSSIFGSGEPAEPITNKQKADVQMAMGQTLEKEGNFEEAIKTYEDVLRKDNKRADACLRLAVVHDKKGDAAGAEKYYKMAMKADPKNAEIRCDLGYSYYLQRRWSEAQASLTKAIELKPDLRRAHTNLALVYARTSENAKALKEFIKAGCSEAEAHSNLGYALMLQEQWADAQREFQRDLDMNPQSKPAQAGLATLHSITSRKTPVASSEGSGDKPAADPSQVVFREEPSLAPRSE